MTIYDFFGHLTMGGWLALVVIASMLVEITPIKINPVQWLGNRLNTGIMKRVDAIERKVDDHIAQDFRNKILDFQNGLLINGYTFYTQEQYSEVLEAINSYEHYCKTNNLNNDKCRLAIEYIERCYIKCLDSESFANLPTN